MLTSKHQSREQGSLITGVIGYLYLGAGRLTSVPGSGARFTKVRTNEFCSTNSLSLNYRSNEFVALTNLCETGPRTGFPILKYVV